MVPHVKGHKGLCFTEEVLLAALNKLQQVGLADAHQLCHFLVTTLSITTAIHNTWSLVSRVTEACALQKKVQLTALHKLQQVGLADAHQLTTLCITTAHLGNT